MNADLSRDHTVANCVGLKKPLLEDQEYIISICNELFCSGRPLAEVLEEVKKRLSDERIRNTVKPGAPAPIIGLAEDRPPPVLQEQVPEPQLNPGSSVLILRPGFMQRRLGRRGTLVAIGLVVLILVTIGGYVQLGTAARQPTPNRQSELQLLRQLHEQGQFISKSLRPGLDNAELRDVGQINAAVKLHAGEAQAITLLFAPGGGQSFYYVASWPNGGDDLEAQRRQLTRLGILDRLAASCHNAASFELLGSKPTFGNEGVAVNPLWTPAGCWVVVSFLSLDLSRVSNTPASWTVPGVQIGRLEALSQP
jgi:hypothetical protein